MMLQACSLWPLLLAVTQVRAVNKSDSGENHLLRLFCYNSVSWQDYNSWYSGHLKNWFFRSLSDTKYLNKCIDRMKLLGWRTVSQHYFQMVGINLWSSESEDSYSCPWLCCTLTKLFAHIEIIFFFVAAILLFLKSPVILLHIFLLIL